MIRVLIRTSRWAIWSRRLGSFALPLMVVPAFLHRSRGIGSETFELILGIALLVALLALLTGVIAFIRLWSTGDRGWGRATVGLALGLICLAPAIYGAVQGARYPMVNDVSTDWNDPPQFLSGSVESPDAAMQERLREAFPNAVNRTYRLPGETVFDLAETLVGEREWEIRSSRAPGSFGRPGQINAIAMTLMGWRDEVAVMVTAGTGGTSVSMRSHSLSGLADLGENGRRIESFLVDLDTRVSEWNRDHPEISE